MEGVNDALKESFQMRLKDNSENSEVEVSEKILDAVYRTLNLPVKTDWQGIEHLWDIN
ncbi:MAG: hypothetical protein QNJ54_37330 [Prochloraceae cyanobacterium]|nr:hypothetical protein [Prochloraceae cyanobacterium]